MEITFLGVRGSIPCAGPEYIKYGGHTSCVLVKINNQNLIFDSGSGIVDANLSDDSQAHLFFSHVHLDHVIGLPFFKPVWSKKFFLNFYSCGIDLKAYLEDMFSPPLFPILFKDFPCQKRFIDITQKITIEDTITVDTCVLNHPNGATGYKVSAQGKSVCYITDTEHKAEGLDSNILALIENTDLFIYDATYTDETYEAHKGWGHSTWQEAYRLAQKAKAKQTILFHHAPDHTDDKMDAISKIVTPLGLEMAKQGMKIKI